MRGLSEGFVYVKEYKSTQRNKWKEQTLYAWRWQQISGSQRYKVPSGNPIYNSARGAEHLFLLWQCVFPLSNGVLEHLQQCALHISSCGRSKRSKYQRKLWNPYIANGAPRRRRLNVFSNRDFCPLFFFIIWVDFERFYTHYFIVNFEKLLTKCVIKRLNLKFEPIFNNTF